MLCGDFFQASGEGFYLVPELVSATRCASAAEHTEATACDATLWSVRSSRSSRLSPATVTSSSASRRIAGTTASVRLQSLPPPAASARGDKTSI